MMRVLLAVAIWAAVSSAAMAGEKYAFPVGRSIALAQDAVLACRSARPLRQAMLFTAQGDKEATKKQLAIALGSGECRTLKAGDVVFVVRSNEDDDVIVVRRKGEVRSGLSMRPGCRAAWR